MVLKLDTVRGACIYNLHLHGRKASLEVVGGKIKGLWLPITFMKTIDERAAILVDKGFVFDTDLYFHNR